jgi:hypothetical protein
MRAFHVVVVCPHGSHEVVEKPWMAVAAILPAELWLTI